MKLISTAIAGVFVSETKVHQDYRGAFTRFFCERELAGAIGGRTIEQINRSRTASVGAVRGMHFQLPPHAEMKMVRCIRGRAWDVAVDLRRGSSTFLKHHAQEISEANGLMLIIPEGCAHGFQVLEPDTELLYLHTASYMPSAEGGVRFDDPALGLTWPLPITDLSDRDRSHPLLTNNFSGIAL